MSVKVISSSVLLDRLVAPRPRNRAPHRLAEELEAMDFSDSLLRALGLLEYDEGLALGLEVLLRNNIGDGAKLREDRSEGFS